MHQAKRKSAVRFKQVNVLCDQVIANLPSLSHRLILLVGWRHADERGIFSKSLAELATYSGMSKRQVQRAIDDLVGIGALRVLRDRRGTIAACYQITGKPKQPASVDTSSTLSQPLV